LSRWVLEFFFLMAVHRTPGQAVHTLFAASDAVAQHTRAQTQQRPIIAVLVYDVFVLSPLV